MAESGNCCQCCAGFLLSSGLSALFLWLSLRPSKPTYSIENFYVPALNKTANDTRNTTVFFHLLLKNPNKDKAIYYYALNVSLYHGDNLTLPVGNLTIPGFHQGHKKKADRWENVTVVGVPWDAAKREVSTGTTVFRVDMAATVKYKIVFWKTRFHKMEVGANVTVNDQGSKSTDDGVKLSSAPARRYCAHVGLFALMFLFWF